MSDAPEAASPPETEHASGGLDALISSAIESSGYGADDAPAAEPAPEAQPSTDDRPRDAQGRFIAKDSADPVPSQAEPVQVEANPALQPAADPAKVQPIEPHPRWPADFKAEFAKWPPEVQRAFLDRDKATEAEYTRKTQELAETRKTVEPLIGEVSKWSPYLQQIGVTADQAFGQMLQAEYTLRTGQPLQQAQGIAHLMATYRIPVEAVLHTLGIPIAAGQDGQNHAQIEPAISNLRQQLSTVQAELQQWKHQAATAERQRAEAEFNALAQAKDDSGQVKFPHFERVRQPMLQLVASGQAQTWDEAYSKAVRLDDELHAQIVEAERKRVADEAEKARQEAVLKARKAAPVHESGGSPKGAAKPKGLDAHLSAAMEHVQIGA